MAKLSREEIRTRLAMAMTEAVKKRKQAGEKLRLPCAWDSAGLAEYEMLTDVVLDILTREFGFAPVPLSPRPKDIVDAARRLHDANERRIAGTEPPHSFDVSLQCNDGWLEMGAEALRMVEEALLIERQKLHPLARWR